MSVCSPVVILAPALGLALLRVATSRWPCADQSIQALPPELAALALDYSDPASLAQAGGAVPA